MYLSHTRKLSPSESGNLSQFGHVFSLPLLTCELYWELFVMGSKKYFLQEKHTVEMNEKFSEREEKTVEKVFFSGKVKLKKRK